MDIGVIAMAAKPFHKGHYALIKRASDENDRVHLYISTGDRVRPKQFPIYWKNMKNIWNQYILKSLPSNIQTHFVANPMQGLMDYMIEANDKFDNADTYRIYSGGDDMARYDNPRNKSKNFSNLLQNDQLFFINVPRAQTGGASGTKTRKAIEDGNLEMFVKLMPDPLRPKADIIFKKLGGKIA